MGFFMLLVTENVKLDCERLSRHDIVVKFVEMGCISWEL